jgi:hypothetical protein
VPSKYIIYVPSYEALIHSRSFNKVLERGTALWACFVNSDISSAPFHSSWSMMVTPDFWVPTCFEDAVHSLAIPIRTDSSVASGEPNRKMLTTVHIDRIKLSQY